MIFKSTDFVEQIDELSTTPYNVVISRNRAALEQTKRNNTKKELVDGLAAYLTAILDGGCANVYRTADGVAIEIPNEHVYAQEKEMDVADVTNGTIVFTVDITMRDLEYDAYTLADNYAEDQEAKAKAAAEKAAKAAARAAKQTKSTPNNDPTNG